MSYFTTLSSLNIIHILRFVHLKRRKKSPSSYSINSIVPPFMSEYTPVMYEVQSKAMNYFDKIGEMVHTSLALDL